jgi:hypothetical protein
MRAAMIHYWPLNMRGGEKGVATLCRMLPEADRQKFIPKK